MKIQLKEDLAIEKKIRPEYLKEFIGHSSILKRLNILTNAAKSRSEPLPHILFHGPPGLGKTTLSLILAKEMNSSITQTSAPAITKAADLAGILTNMEEGDILFIDEIHRLSKNVEEYLYQAMEDFSLDIIIDSGHTAKSVNIKLKPFTLVGATTKTGLLSAPLRTRFPFNVRLDFYDLPSICQIVKRSADVLKVQIDEKAALEIALRSRATPRIANNLLRWVRDFYSTQTKNLTDKDAIKALQMLSIDQKGLDEIDIRLLCWIIDHHGGGPVGIKSIAIAIGEDPLTIETVQEPYLVMQGYLKRGPRGREVTPLAYSHLGKKLPKGALR
jgi:Holliday junction DNA helicase RuvB